MSQLIFKQNDYNLRRFCENTVSNLKQIGINECFVYTHDEDMYMFEHLIYVINDIHIFVESAPYSFENNIIIIYKRKVINEKPMLDEYNDDDCIYQLVLQSREIYYREQNIINDILSKIEEHIVGENEFIMK